MARVVMNLRDIGDLDVEYPPFIRHDRMFRLGNAGGYPKLTVDGVVYGGTAIYDNGWVDSNWELIDPLPANTTKYEVLNFAVALGLTYLPPITTAMKLTWTGGAAVTSVTNGGNTGVVTTGSNSATFSYTTGGSAPQGGTRTGNSTIIFNLSGTEPPRNIRLFKAALESNLNAGEIFDPTWLTNTSQWKILRLMEWMKANDNPAVDYTDLSSDNFAYFQCNAITKGRKVGLSVNTVIALAEQAQKPIWVNIPHQFTDAAITSLATALKAGTTQMVYVEYSNEDWNATFGQNAYTITQGAAFATAHGIWAANNATEKSRQWAGYQATNVMGLFKAVYGTNSGTRWTGVLGTQSSNSAVTTSKLVGVDYYLANVAPGGTATSDLFTHLAVTSYFGPTPTTVASEPGTSLSSWADTSIAANDGYAYFFQRLYEQLSFNTATSSTWGNLNYKRGHWLSQATAISGRGLTLIQYEGGNDAACSLPLRDNNSGETEGTKINLALAKWADSAKCAALHDQLNDAFVADGHTYPAQFNDLGYHTIFGPWGLAQYIGDPTPHYSRISYWNTGPFVSSPSESTPVPGPIPVTDPIPTPRRKPRRKARLR